MLLHVAVGQLASACRIPLRRVGIRCTNFAFHWFSPREDCLCRPLSSVVSLSDRSLLGWYSVFECCVKCVWGHFLFVEHAKVWLRCYAGEVCEVEDFAQRSAVQNGRLADEQDLVRVCVTDVLLYLTQLVFCVLVTVL